MVRSHQSDHDGWILYTFCEEANPLDWAPGKPPVYAVRGFAEFARPHEYKPGYRSTTRVDYPERGKLQFFDYNKAHEHVQSALRTEIDGLKMDA